MLPILKNSAKILEYVSGACIAGTSESMSVNEDALTS